MCSSPAFAGKPDKGKKGNTTITNTNTNTGANNTNTGNSNNANTNNNSTTPKKTIPFICKSYKTKKAGVFGKDGAKDIPSWAVGQKPCQDPLESGNDFATRLMNERYSDDWSGNAVRKTEYSQLRKYTGLFNF